MHEWTEPELHGRAVAPPIEGLEPRIESVVSGVVGPPAVKDELRRVLRMLAARAYALGARSAAEELRRNLG